MATLISGVEFTGSLGNVTAYRMRGTDKIILRRKGGATKKRIKNDPKFDLTRRNNAEFAGRSAASKYVMKMLQPVKALADYNIAGPLNALMKPIQELDTTSDLGKRYVMLSKNGGIIEGFSLNRQALFESVVRAPVTGRITRETLSAEVEIPALIPGINFKPRGTSQRRGQEYPLYSFRVVLGMVPDLFFTKDGYQPSHSEYTRYVAKLTDSPWFKSLEGSEATALALKLDVVPPNNDFALLLSIGIRYGKLASADLIQQVKYAGSAKVLMVAGSLA